VLFSAVACVTIFLFTVRKNYILPLLGWVLTPLLLASLVTIIIIGLSSVTDIQKVDHANGTMFLHGLKEGYNTMDLLAAFFFSSTILNILRESSRTSSSEYISPSRLYVNTALRASLVGAILLAAIYVGFSYLSAFHANQLVVNGKDELLGAITMKIAGTYAGVLVCITIALACLTTAIALISAFTDFIQKEVLRNKVSYEMTLIGALLLTFFVSTFEFTGISTFLGPILQICYPGLIVLTLLNIAYHLKNFKPIKVPVFFAFCLSAYFYFFQ
jgi:LIVCS family branched-chain amino acid:cation transporter